MKFNILSPFSSFKPDSSATFVVMAGTLISVSVRAEPVCNTVAECEQVITTAQIQISAARARIQELQSSARLGPVVRTPDGRGVGMTQEEARKFCDSSGKRLPTARELALAMNPIGIHERPVEGRRLPRIYEQNGGVDFYYDKRTYVRPEGDAGVHAFWSSSLHPSVGESAYYFNGSDGDIDYYLNSYKLGVRCADR